MCQHLIDRGDVDKEHVIQLEGEKGKLFFLKEDSESHTLKREESSKKIFRNAVALFVGPRYNVIELKGSSLFRVPTKDRSYILFYSHSHLWVISRENKDYI